MGRVAGGAEHVIKDLDRLIGGESDPGRRRCRVDEPRQPTSSAPRPMPSTSRPVPSSTALESIADHREQARQHGTTEQESRGADRVRPQPLLDLHRVIRARRNSACSSLPHTLLASRRSSSLQTLVARLFCTRARSTGSRAWTKYPTTGLGGRGTSASAPRGPVAVEHLERTRRHPVGLAEAMGLPQRPDLGELADSPARPRRARRSPRAGGPSPPACSPAAPQRVDAVEELDVVRVRSDELASAVIGLAPCPRTVPRTGPLDDSCLGVCPAPVLRCA